MAFIAHPSVRIKGTEHTYSPVVCEEEECSGKDKGAHMHCPLCTVAEAYQDPVILRAHFRVKHVDKGIDFAGLKVLRCCNHCEIVGTIKGEKRFKGAHWHCYRCRNGFNRRDEAVKHYKTHFRNPHTTFQIQVTPEVNCRQYYDGSAEAHATAYGGPTVCTDSRVEGSALATILVQPVLSTKTEEPKVSYMSHELCSVNNGILVASEEEVDPSQHALDRTQTLVLMDPEGQAGNLIYEEAAGIIEEQSGEGLEQTLQSGEGLEQSGEGLEQSGEGLEHTLQLEQQVLELQQQNEALRMEKDAMEEELQAEIQRLQDQVSTVLQANLKLSEELNQCCSVEMNQQRVKRLVQCLEEQHRQLIQAQLATLTRELMSQAEAAAPENGHMGAAELSAGLDDVSVRERGVNTVEVQVDCKTEDSIHSISVPLPDCVGLQSGGSEELVAELEDGGGAPPVVVQATGAPLQMEEDVLLSLWGKRKPKDEPGVEPDSKLPRTS